MQSEYQECQNLHSWDLCQIKNAERENKVLMSRLKVSVNPALSKDDRKALSAYIQSLKFHRPKYVAAGSSFSYRGSKVTIS